ncbi:trypsin-like peptidase domain-containing protein [Streptomyces sp. NPDC001315]|uniref:trypsin-like peptidase domain-containing protein n=1 Tax=Streptomyces sp. NPDC001315 TaxID=3364562 RepID=UPI0036A94D1A
MSEGKPTKAKWWSRPRPHDGSAERAAAPETDEGDFELERPAVIADGDTHEGDFVLEQPAPATASVAAPAAADLGQPMAAVPEGGRAAADPDEPDESHEPDEPVAIVSAPVPAPLPAPPSADRPKPLHDPDPYSTPPYGEPGPWAPAPPVQHPSATPTHGTTVPAPGPAASTQGASAPHAPAAEGAPVPPGPAAQDAEPVPSAPHGPYAAHGLPPHGAPAAVAAPAQPPALPQAPFPDTPPPTDPWQRYDPWAPAPLATAAPLQLNGAAVPSERQRRSRVRRALVGGAVLLALVAGGVGGVVGAYLERNGGLGTVELPQAGEEDTGRAPDSVAGIAARALPGVVTLHVTGAEEQGTGTGFVLDTRGHILTNNHVVEPAGADGDITVVFNGGETAKAEVVGHDSGYDLAVVKVTGVSGLRPVPLGNSDNVRVGDPVVAIGAPFDLEGTVTSGIISAKERPITAGGETDGSDVSYVDALQTDAPINPGNSGGPLLDSQARVIGINSAIRSADSGSDSETGQAGSIGLGFAIPVNQGKRVAEELINTGRATHPVIGVTLDMDYTGDGARVGTKSGDGGSPVTVGGPGDRAGLKAGDVITEVDGRPVHSGEELIVKTRAHRPGDSLELTVEHDGRQRNVTLVLGSADGD